MEVNEEIIKLHKELSSYNQGLIERSEEILQLYKDTPFIMTGVKKEYYLLALFYLFSLNKNPFLKVEDVVPPSIHIDNKKVLNKLVRTLSKYLKEKGLYSVDMINSACKYLSSVLGYEVSVEELTKIDANTLRQKAILYLLSKNFTDKEIAKIVNCAKSNISIVKKKMRDELEVDINKKELKTAKGTTCLGVCAY